MKFNKKNTKFTKSFYFIILIILLIIGIGGRWLIWYFKTDIKQARQYKQNIESMVKKIQEKKTEYKNDVYGAANPEQTYKMFLDALKNKNIDLAVKYFLPDIQEEYKKLFLDIENKGQWNEMMSDLLNSKNQKGEFIDENTYVIEIINNQDVSVTTIVLKRPLIRLGIDETLLSDIWKIAEF